MSRIEFFASKFHYSFGPHSPTLRVQSGTKLRVICPDCDNRLSDESELRADQRCQNDPVNPIQGNPLAGPIFIEDARQGDVLAVKIEAIELDRESGITLLAPNHGVVPSDLFVSLAEDGRASQTAPRHMYRWKIDRVSNTATIENPIGEINFSVPLSPFVGCIGVCPPDGQYVSSLHCGPFGGNLDLPAIKAGAIVFLPVNQDGALLMLGDIHAAQGHGEIIGGGVETSGKVECTLKVLKEPPINTCAIWDNDRISVLGTHVDLRQSIQKACGGLVSWLAQVGDINRFDLYNAISQTVTIILGNLNKPPFPSAASVRLAELPQPLCDAVQRLVR